jgi:hypothetical protein
MLLQTGNPELAIDILYSPIYFRLLAGPLPLDRQFAEGLARLTLKALKRTSYYASSMASSLQHKSALLNPKDCVVTASLADYQGQGQASVNNLPIALSLVVPLP